MATSKLEQALVLSNTEELTKLVRAGADPDTVYQERSILGVAAWHGNTELAQLLIDKGADLNVANSEPLGSACTSTNSGSVDVLKLLIENGVNLDVKLPSGDTPVMEAIRNRNKKGALLLIASGADVAYENEYGEGALSLAEDSGPQALINAVREKLGGTPAETEEELFIARVYQGSFTAKKTAHTSGDPNIASIYKSRTFPGCAHPPIHLLSVDLTEIEEFPELVRKLGRLPVVYQWCSDCDPPESQLDLKIAKDGSLSLYARGDKGACSTRSSRGSTRMSYVRLKRTAGDDSLPENGIAIGGEPHWVQGEEWAVCPKCDTCEFFIGRIDQARVPPGAGGADYHLFVFVCPTCRIESVTMQMT